MKEQEKPKSSKKPKYNLDTIKLAFNTIDKLNMTASAMNGQYELGFSDKDVVDTIQALTSNDFHKSMPPEREGFSAWHDVYKPTFKHVKLYVKFQIDKRGEIIISFKAR
ncbi:MAG: type II toxin-antitoxin system MqsR family toxin [Gammaproteobacteria bacterium]|nr:type II toxin-antitoxin system MqsR family toxin [Gammaproteobacteria bacterium]